MKLEISGLSFSYSDRDVLDQLDIQVGEGEFVSILGASGCGKSTILKLLTGVLTPAAGRIAVDGEEIHGMTGHFAYMPQNDLLFPWKTILDNVCLYGRIHGTMDSARKEARENMAAFGLAGYEDAYPSALSGGMRQRAAFLRTALCKSEILLLDEPFGALDVITRGEMQDWLLSMREKMNRTVVLVTHDMDEAIYLSDRILILGGRPSRVICQLTPETPAEGRSRDWLYGQGELRRRIHREIMGDGDARERESSAGKERS